VSVIVRHEILHEFLTHAARKEKWLTDHPEYMDNHELANIAADFEISNRAYTDADKSTIKAIIMGDEVLSGLITEDQRPGWENMTFEDMFKRLLDERKQDEDALKDLIDLISRLNDKSLEDLEEQGQQAQDSIDDAQQSLDGNNEDKGKDGEEQDGEGTASGSGQDSEDGEEGKSDGKKHLPKSDGDIAKELADMEKEVQDAQRELEKIRSKVDDTPDSSDDPFPTESEQRDIADVAARAQRIEDLFKNDSIRAQLIKEAEAPVKREKAAKAAAEDARYKNNPLRKFKLSLNRFIADQIGLNREETWSRLNPSYEDSEFLIPGVSRQETLTIPLINVYHDVSASFSDEKKTATAMSAIASLNEHVRKGKIQVRYYYFAERVSNTREGAGSWATRGQPILNHIAETKPNNVIVITDSDITDCYSEMKVPGAVWFLFYGGKSQNLIDHLSGKKQTKGFMIGEE
jgi:hypothetical protein